MGGPKGLSLMGSFMFLLELNLKKENKLIKELLCKFLNYVSGRRSFLLYK